MWILNILQRTPNLKVDVVGHIDGKSYSYLSRLGAKSRCVCGECNNGWMSRLETLVRHVVGPLIQDISIPLSAESQLIVALWCLRMAMVMEFISRSQEPAFYTQRECEGLRSHFVSNVPAPLVFPVPTFIWLARYGGPVDVASSGINIWSDPPNRPGVSKGYVSTIVAGRLALQVLSLRLARHCRDRSVSIDPIPQPLSGPWRECLVPIWPPASSVVYWPPAITLREDGVSLKMFAERWSKGIRPRKNL